MKQRFFTGVLFLAVFILMLWSDGYLFASCVALLTVGTFLEYVRLTKAKVWSVEALLSTLFILFILTPLFLYGQNQASDAVYFIGGLRYFNFVLVLIGYVLLLFIAAIFIKSINIEKNAMLLMGTFYIGFGYFFFGQMKMEYGFTYVLTIMILVWATDTCCYLVGKAFGKHKLAPSISPNKTIEGSIGGIFGAFLIGMVVFLSLDTFNAMPISEMITIILTVSIFGQLGDLAESLLKRKYDVKDSGNILPGHGGLLDRFDSLLFVFPILTIVLVF